MLLSLTQEIFWFFNFFFSFQDSDLAIPFFLFISRLQLVISYVLHQITGCRLKESCSLKERSRLKNVAD